MSPVESRKRLPASWASYDRAKEIAFVLASAKSLTAKLPGSTEADIDPAQVVEMLDAYRAPLRERIEADAKGGGQ